jgi:hypothetical protein
MARQYESMFGLQRQLTEQAAQLNQGGGGNEVIGLVKDIGDKLGDWAGRYTGGKSREAVEQMRSQAEIARANSDAIKATQERMSEMARLEAALKSGAVVQMPDGSFRAGPGQEQAAIPAAVPVHANGHANGHAVNGNGAHGAPANGKPWATPKVPRTAPGNGLSGPAVEQMKTPAQAALQFDAKRKIMGFTDEEWFGPMLPDVVKLRQAVDLFITGVNEVPPRKPEDSASPDECAFVINQAATEIMRLQIPIMAMTKLLIEGRVADFLDVLLPDSHQKYRDDVVQILMAGGGDEEDEDEDDDEDDEDEDDGQAEVLA